ncbi:MAG: DEAD/DEAH box helicase, partial [Beijerinckiaceae bacterium]
MSFSELGLSQKVQDAVQAAGYTTPTPIQAQAIPYAMQRRDVLGIAQTGTGKTAAFTLPMLSLLETGRARARMPRTLILEPTRELAAQVQDSFEKYSGNQKLNVALLIGGVSFGDQDQKIMRGVDVLIATPGRLLDHVERGKLLLTGIEILVIDEADRMLDMGFIPDIERIAKLVPFTRQTLFFSATMPPEIQKLADQFLHNPARVEVSRPATAASTITQKLVASGRKDFEKRDVLRNLMRNADGLKNAIVFCNRKREVATLHRSLVKHGFAAVCLHGDMDQHARNAALDEFKNGAAAILVASDVAARGLDIPDVSHVFNYDVPHHPDDYVHRIGRTGRAGRAGAAFSIVTGEDTKSIAAIEKLTGVPIAWDTPPPAAEDDDAPRGRGRRGRGNDRHEGKERSARDGGRDRNARRGNHDNDRAASTDGEPVMQDKPRAKPVRTEEAPRPARRQDSADAPRFGDSRSE